VAEGILKVFHACEQDMAMLRKAVGVMPTPVFDTQQAALFISPKAQFTGLAELASNLLKIKMNKDCQRSNWEQRPLSPEQLKYAVNDVRYLRSLYPPLKLLLDEKNKWYQWAFERSASIGAPKQDKIAIQLSDAQKSLKSELRKLLEDRSEALGVAPLVLATSREIDMFITTAEEQRMAFLALPYRGELFWKKAASIASSVVVA
jgi:ribonuclease D